MISVNVMGGTGAGRKLPLKERRWLHACIDPKLGPVSRYLPSYSCPHCGAGVREMISVNVMGGTGAGRKLPLKERRWLHACIDPKLGPVSRYLPSYSCPHCGARRPT